MIFFIIFQHEFIAAAANKNKFYNFLLGKLIRMSRLRSLARFILLFVKKFIIWFRNSLEETDGWAVLEIILANREEEAEHHLAPISRRKKRQIFESRFVVGLTALNKSTRENSSAHNTWCLTFCSALPKFMTTINFVPSTKEKENLQDLSPIASISDTKKSFGH